MCKLTIARRETGLAFLDPKGNVSAYLPATGDAKAQSATSEYEILRGDLAGLLLDGIDESKKKGAHVNVVYGESIDTLDDRADGTGVDITFKNGKLPDQRFDVVIGADGIGSSTRRLIFGKDDKPEHIKPSGMYLGFFSIPRIPGDDNTWRWCTYAPGLSIHLRPHRNNKTMGVYLGICGPKQERLPELETIVHSDVATQKQYLHQRFKTSQWDAERFLKGLDDADDFYMSHWCRVRTPQWTRGRCVILGDAAFATMGVGTSLAMTGAYCISGELSKITSSSDVPQALQEYESRFRPYVSGNDIPFQGLMNLMNPQTEWGTWVKLVIFKLLFGLKLVQLGTWIAGLFGAGDDGGWKLPEYGW